MKHVKSLLPAALVISPPSVQLFKQALPSEFVSPPSIEQSARHLSPAALRILPTEAQLIPHWLLWLLSRVSPNSLQSFKHALPAAFKMSPVAEHFASHWPSSLLSFVSPSIVQSDMQVIPSALRTYPIKLQSGTEHFWHVFSHFFQIFFFSHFPFFFHFLHFLGLFLSLQIALVRFSVMKYK